MCLGILLGAAAIIGLHGGRDDTHEVADGRIDARTGLTPSEQGILADLYIAAEDIGFALEDGPAPTPDGLADEGMPPFATGPETAGRGGHAWELTESAAALAYLGRSSDSAKSGDLVLLVDADGHAAPSVWLGSAETALPGVLTPDNMSRQGWREIVTTYDASVTRPTGTAR